MQTHMELHPHVQPTGERRTSPEQDIFSNSQGFYHGDTDDNEGALLEESEADQIALESSSSRQTSPIGENEPVMENEHAARSQQAQDFIDVNDPEADQSMKDALELNCERMNELASLNLLLSEKREQMISNSTKGQRSQHHLDPAT